ncbi:hypothetical protein JP0114_13390 [Helicobacter pylori]
MKEMSSYQKRKAELKAKDQVIEFLKGHSSPEESYRDEGKEHSKSCLGFE